ncbi:MAG: DUF2860 family protein, partial [Bacteroidales bacterium]|nr:DUF2860 family protein [Bacteroidales bacterium]
TQAQVGLMGQDAPGLSGFVQITGGLFNYRTNTIAGFLKSGISDKVTYSLYKEPDTEFQVTPLGALELKYTFKNKNTQLFFGSSILDIVRLDLVQQFAVRKLLKNDGYLSIGILLSTVPVTVWEDPFIVDVERVETIRNSRGIRVEWVKIGQSNIGVRYDIRKIELKEHSGKFLGLSIGEQQLLDRNGFSHRMTINYTKKISDSHTFVPIINISYNDTKGESKKGLGMSVEISHAYHKNRIVLVTNLSGGYRKYKAINPIYQTKQSNTEFGVVESLFYRLNNNPNRVLLMTTSLAYVQSKSNINFFTQSGLLAQVGIMLRFSPKLEPDGKNELQKD